MNIAFDTRPPPGGRRTGNKLIDRIADDFENSGPGPVRTRGGRGTRARGRGGPREERGNERGRGGGGSGGGGRRGAGREVPTSKSLADLDKELEAFMGEGTKEASGGMTASASAPTGTGGGADDIAMA